MVYEASYNKGMSTTKFVALQSLQSDIARKIKSADKALEAARELLREVSEGGGYCDAEKCAAQNMAGQLCKARTDLSRLAGFSMADDAEWLTASESGKPLLAAYVAQHA